MWLIKGVFTILDPFSADEPSKRKNGILIEKWKDNYFHTRLSLLVAILLVSIKITYYFGLLQSTKFKK